MNFNRLILHTSRLDLRLFKESDLSDFYEYAKEPGVGEMAGWPHHESISVSKEILKHFIDRGKTFAIVYKENNKVIGSIGLEDVRFDNDKIKNLKGYELGFVLSKDYWNLGIMTEAIKEMVRFLLLDLKLDYLAGSCSLDNLRSKRVFIKNHFNIENNIIFNGHESHSFILLRKDYLNMVEKIQAYDINLNRIDRFIYRGENIKNGLVRGVVDIIIYNEKYDKYLVTRRDRNKETFPNMLETTGGAIRYKELEEESAKREVLEETGISDIDLTFLYIYHKKVFNCIYFIYYGKTNCNLDSILLQKEETSEYMWLEKIDYYNLWQSDLVNPNQKKRLSEALELIKYNKL